MKPKIEFPDSSWSILLIIAAGFFLVEIAELLLMPMLKGSNELNDLIIDALIPTIILTPFLWWLFKSRNRFEKALKESEKRFRPLFEGAPDAIFLADPETGIIIDANSRASELTARPHEEIIGMHQAQLHPPRIEEYSRVTFKEHARKTYHPFENLVLRPDGTEVPVEVLAQMVTIKGKPVLQGVFRDITERKKAQDELLKFKLGIERSDESVFITKFDGTIIYVNPAFEKIYGYSREEALGKTPRILKSGLIPSEEYKPFWDTLLSKNVVKGELINKTKDGRLLNIGGSANPILNEEGDIIGFLAIQRDITEAKQAEELLRKSMLKLEKAQELGQMGSWEWDIATNELIWSDEVYKLYGLDPANDSPKYDVVVNTMTPETRDWFSKAIEDAMKHGIPLDGEYGLFNDENVVELKVSDNGVGIPSDVDFRKTESLGLRLVTILAEDQLQGKIDLDRSRGTEFIIKFKGGS
ncbi:MAG: PAS domain S-box protein [Euryarchaeota archaeon]|nr:PAS domain S-box protein [Euryarchaeota archaeon]MCG2735430.1 PAS domain S-box protein [Candidatus Methanoperedenaceae archaeon]